MALLLILLNVCHWLGDYTHLQMPHMLLAKKIGRPIGPILQHAFMHSFLIMFILIPYTDALTGVSLMAFQFITHFGIDLLKGKCNVWFPSLTNPANPFHWYVFGLDQLLHQIVLIIIASIAIT